MLAIYTRLSKEDADSTSIENQLREGKSFAKDNSFNDIKIYNEGEGISGGAKIKDRPKLDSLIKDIVSGQIKAVWFRHQNRLERDTETYIIFMRYAESNEIDVFFDDKKFDFNNPTENVMGVIFSTFNQYSRKMQSYQTKKTLKDNAREGKVWSVVAYGYKSENGFLAIDEDESLIVKRVFNESLKGVGTRKIAEIFNNEGILTRYNKIGKGTLQKTNKQTKRVTKSRTKDISWSGNTIRNIITNTLYKGERKFSGDVYESPIIINPILWQEVNDNLKKNRNNSGKQVDHKYLLKGKLICSKCGRNYYGRRRVDLSDNFYMCSSKRIKNQNCGNRSINITVLENLIWKRFFADKNLKTVVDRFFKTNDTATILYDLDAELANLNKDLSKSKQEKQNAIKLAISGVLSEDDVKPEIDRIKTETIEIEIKIKQLEEQIFFYNNSVSKINEIGKDLDFSDVNISFNDKRELINKYIDFIEIHYLESSYIIFIAFNIKDLDAETYIVDRNYNLAYDTCEKIIIPLSDKFIKYDLNTQENKAKELLGKIPNENIMDLDLGRVMWDGHYLLN